jgi:hypothetical protein
MLCCLRTGCTICDNDGKIKENAKSGTLLPVITNTASVAITSLSSSDPLDPLLYL